MLSDKLVIENRGALAGVARVTDVQRYVVNDSYQWSTDT